jgi:hypothetical protein
MSNLVKSLFRIDPTEGLVRYVNAVKPYHTKVLDVLVEYVYTEQVKVTVRDKWSWDMSFTLNKVDTEYNCGYGTVWDPIKTPDSNPSVNIISAQGKVRFIVNEPTDGTTWSTYFSEHTIARGNVVVTTTGTLPTTEPQLLPGATYELVGSNNAFELYELEGTQPIQFLGSGAGEMFVEIIDKPFNSFLIEPKYGAYYSVAVTNARSNQMSFVDTYEIISISPSEKKLRVNGDIRPVIPVVNVVFDDATIANKNVPGNCSFSFQGNVEGFFKSGTTFIVSGAPNNNGTYRVSDELSGRLLTRYDGQYTTVPVDQAISTKEGGGNAIIALTTIIPTNSTVYVSGNTGVGTNGRYTVSSVAFVSGHTDVYVNEQVSLLSGNDGSLHVPVDIARLPSWPGGMEVSFTTTTTLPRPLSVLDRYFFAPTGTAGTFNLSTKRYPTEYSDYVNLSEQLDGVVSIRRAGVFVPGAYVKIQGSHLGRNDGNYVIKDMQREGDNIRMYVMEQVRGTTPSNRSYDGVMTFNFESYDAPVYCPAAKTSDLYAGTYIHESISFEFSIHLEEKISSEVVGDYLSGWGNTPFGQGKSSPFGTTEDGFNSFTAPTNTGTLLPHGYDMQLFDVGAMLEIFPHEGTKR